uniref:Uncharacterized protein n=1 Tax=Zea mays TaxID=4577 RepID=A0A804QTL3_MAIZE
MRFENRKFRGKVIIRAPDIVPKGGDVPIMDVIDPIKKIMSLFIIPLVSQESGPRPGPNPFSFVQLRARSTSPSQLVLTVRPASPPARDLAQLPPPSGSSSC